MNFILLIALIATTVFADGTYIKCNDKDGNIIEQEFAKNGLTEFSFMDMYTDKYVIEIDYRLETNEFKYEIYEANSYLLMQSTIVYPKANEEVLIISGHSCMLIK